MKLTKEEIESHIAKKEFERKGKMTICFLTLENGFQVIGTSAPIHAEDYNEEIGMHYSYEKALDKVRELYGFLATEKESMKQLIEENKKLKEYNGKLIKRHKEEIDILCKENERLNDKIERLEFNIESWKGLNDVLQEKYDLVLRLYNKYGTSKGQSD